MTDNTFRSGYVAVIGRPNVGKSTLLNQLIRQKIAATSKKPQTTRKRLLGILTSKQAQILFVDSPGHHAAKGPLHRFMVAEIQRALQDADVALYVVEARRDGAITPGNKRIMETILRTEKPIVLVINKIDRVPDKRMLLPLISAYKEALDGRLHETLLVSAKTRSGIDRIPKAIVPHLPHGPAYFESDQVTDASERAIASELVREKIIEQTGDELPYVTAVAIDEFVDERPKIVRMSATIFVERTSQKPIVVGSGGERVKAIGSRARPALEALLGAKVFLQLVVRVAEDWTRDPRALSRMGYGTHEGDTQVNLHPPSIDEGIS